jgi:fructokinase
MPRIGVDLGGTKIEGIVLDDDGSYRLRRRVATPAGDYDGTLRAVVDLVAGLESSVGRTCRIGIGTPGAPSPANGLLRNANSTCLNGRPVRQDLETLLDRPVRIANDADCFALSEATDGAAAGADSVFGVIIGTGTGGGVVIDGRLLQGPNAIAGEWGHNPLPWPRDEERPGPLCYCGKRGCIETWLSGPGMARDFDPTGTTTPPGIVDLATQGDAAAEACLQRYEDRLARSLAGVINLLDPEVIVLGGGLSQIGRLYTGVTSRLARYLFSDTLRTRLLPPRHGDSSGVRGAARLWSEAVQVPVSENGA